MRGVLVTDFGPVESTRMVDVPEPSPGPGEVLLEIRATAVNYVDLLVMAGTYQFLPSRPFVPGKLPAGVVLTVGRQVEDFRPGDRVLTMAEHGGYAERIAVPRSGCHRLPESMSFVDAAAMALAYDTAWFALRERARFKQGETVLVLGATGAVGYAAVQLAKAMGATVLAGIASPAKEAYVRSAGADAIVDLKRENLRDSLRAQVYSATANRGADIILDPLGGDIFDAALRALAWNGRLVVIGFVTGRIPNIKANYLMLKNIEVSGLQISDYRKRRADLMAQCFAEIFAWYEAGRVRPAPTRTYALEDYQLALAQLRNRAAKDRIVLVP